MAAVALLWPAVQGIGRPLEQSELGRLKAIVDLGLDPTKFVNAQQARNELATLGKLKQDQLDAKACLVVDGNRHRFCVRETCQRDVAQRRVERLARPLHLHGLDVGGVVHLAGQVEVREVTEEWATIGLWGPRARDVLASVTSADISHKGMPFLSSKWVDINGVRTLASRISYVGDLGWELYVPMEFATHVYDTIVAGGDAFGLRHAGYHALNSLRIEKGYIHVGSETDGTTVPVRDQRVVVTNERGLYRAPLLPLGTYKVKFDYQDEPFVLEIENETNSTDYADLTYTSEQ